MRDPRVVDFFHGVKSDRWKRTSDQETVILSYPDDEGVRLNKGRAGAAQGPKRILFYLGRLVHRLKFQGRISVVEDFPKKKKLLDRHDWAYSIAKKVLDSGADLVTLGGGHDYGFPDASAYRDSIGGEVLNVDAHLDMRPFIQKKANSGTGFRRYIEKYGGEGFTTWGIQFQSNADDMIEFAKNSGSKILPWDQTAPHISGNYGLSVCLDAFAGVRGVSAPSMIGVSIEETLRMISKSRKQLRWMGLYETAPKYDPQNEDSARLAALLAYRFIYDRSTENAQSRAGV